MKLPEPDPTLVATAYRKQRLYLFSRREPADAEDAAVRGRGWRVGRLWAETGLCVWGVGVGVGGASCCGLQREPSDSEHTAVQRGGRLCCCRGKVSGARWTSCCGVCVGGFGICRQSSGEVMGREGSALHGAAELRMCLFHVCRCVLCQAGRDVFNEKPSTEELLAADVPGTIASILPRGAVLHTTKGDITLRLFPDECPRTIENFTTHARNGYYDNVLFHRVIKGFMLQTGDPLGEWNGQLLGEWDRQPVASPGGLVSLTVDWCR